MKKYIYILGLALTGCGGSMSYERPAPTAVQGPTLVKIVSRDTTIVAHSSANGPVYSLQDNKGQVLVPSMTLPQMEAREPELARHIRTMNASTRGNGAWAGVE